MQLPTNTSNVGAERHRLYPTPELPTEVIVAWKRTRVVSLTETRIVPVDSTAGSGPMFGSKPGAWATPVARNLPPATHEVCDARNPES